MSCTGSRRRFGSRAKAFKLVDKDRMLVRFYLPLKPPDPDEHVWCVIRKLTGKIRVAQSHPVSPAGVA